MKVTDTETIDQMSADQLWAYIIHTRPKLPRARLLLAYACSRYILENETDATARRHHEALMGRWRELATPGAATIARATASCTVSPVR